MTTWTTEHERVRQITTRVSKLLDDIPVNATHDAESDLWVFWTGEQIDDAVCLVPVAGDSVRSSDLDRVIEAILERVTDDGETSQA